MLQIKIKDKSFNIFSLDELGHDHWQIRKGFVETCPWCGKTVKGGKGYYNVEAEPSLPYCGISHIKLALKAQFGL
jgi:hypothetical protein